MNPQAPELTADLIRRFDVSGPRYTSYPTADRFVEDFGSADLKYWLSQRNIGASRQPLSIYVHLPFCAARCGYCAFVVEVGREDARDAYLDALLRELARIPGVGQVAFPAGMSDADIEGAIRSKILPAAGEKPSRTAEALKSAAEAVNTGINWAGTQFTKGLTGLAGLPRTAADLNQRSAEWLGEKAGLPATGRAIGQAARFVTPGSGMTPYGCIPRATAS